MGKGERVRSNRRDHDELVEKLRQQLHFLRRSTQEFDAGVEFEAVRLAQSVRVLVHDTGRSTSLLEQLGLKRQLGFRDSAWVPGEDVLSSLGPACSLVVMAGSSYVPVCYMQPTSGAPVLPFEDWWRRPIAGDAETMEPLTRFDLVDALAHKEGGAHVDPDGPSASYRRLDGFNFMEWEIVEGVHPSDPAAATAPGRPLEGSVAAAAMRQIAEEVGVSLTRRVPAPSRR